MSDSTLHHDSLSQYRNKTNLCGSDLHAYSSYSNSETAQKLTTSNQEMELLFQAYKHITYLKTTYIENNIIVNSVTLTEKLKIFFQKQKEIEEDGYWQYFILEKRTEDVSLVG